MRSRIDHFILDDEKNVVVEPDLMTWARWMEPLDNRRMAYDHDEKRFLSTVFLGLDYGFSEYGAPIVFETGYDDGGDNGMEILDRYFTYTEAIAGHERHAQGLAFRLPPKPEERTEMPSVGPRKVRL